MIRNKALVLIAALILPAQAQAFDLFGLISGGSPDFEKFAVEANVGRYSTLNRTKKRGESQIFFTCDFSVALTCDNKGSAGDFDIRIRRVTDESADETRYIVGFHDRNIIGSKNPWEETAPVKWEQLLKGLSFKRQLPQIPDAIIKAVIDQ